MSEFRSKTEKKCTGRNGKSGKSFAIYATFASAKICMKRETHDRWVSRLGYSVRSFKISQNMLLVIETSKTKEGSIFVIFKFISHYNIAIIP